MIWPPVAFYGEERFPCPPLVMERLQFAIQRFFENFDLFGIFGTLGSRDALTPFGASRVTTLLGIFGHAIVVMSLIDFVVVIVPPQAQNPVWELDTINLLMGQIWFFLVGVALVLISYLIRYYLDREASIPVLELVLFKFTRWLILFIAIVCLLMLPLIVVDTVRVNRINTSQIDEATNNQLAQLSQAESQLAQVNDLNQLQTLLPSNATVPPGASLADLKQELQTNLAKQKQRVSDEAAKVQGQKRFNLLKTSTRNILAAIIATFCLFALFWRTRGFVD